MALALQEQLNMEDSGGNAEATAHQAAGQPMAVAPAAMIGRLTGNNEFFGHVSTACYVYCVLFDGLMMDCFPSPSHRC